MTRTLQYNLTPCHGLSDDVINGLPPHKFTKRKDVDKGGNVTDMMGNGRVENADSLSRDGRNSKGSNARAQRVQNSSSSSEKIPSVHNSKETASEEPAMSSEHSDKPDAPHSTGSDVNPMVLGVRTEPEWKYVWNKHLLKDVVTSLHADWLLYITHGFVSQSNVQVFGKSLYVALIARRSNQFAGECAVCACVV